MNFEQLLRQAKKGEVRAREEIFRMYRPLLIKNSMDNSIFDEDLFQELAATLAYMKLLVQDYVQMM